MMIWARQNFRFGLVFSSLKAKTTKNTALSLCPARKIHRKFKVTNLGKFNLPRTRKKFPAHKKDRFHILKTGISFLRIGPKLQ